MFDAYRVLKDITHALAQGSLWTIYLGSAIAGFGPEGKLRDVLFFLVALTAVPLIGSAQFVNFGWSRWRAVDDRMKFVRVVLASLSLFALASLALIAPSISWISGASAVAYVTSACHLVVFLTYFLRPIGFANTKAQSPPAFLFQGFILIFLLTLCVLFWIPHDGSTRCIPLLSCKLLFETSSGTGILGGLVFAIAALLAVFALGWLELRVSQSYPGASRLLRLCALGIAIASVALIFDYSLPADPLHQLTNVAPALQLKHGGTLMVDTFSQYGPGPVVATLAWLTILGETLPAADLGVQIFNLAFYAVWLVCLYRLTRWRLPALALGLMTILFLQAGWGLGVSNINFAPSILGMRYLPTLLAVLAISTLRPPALTSVGTFSATFLSTLWSVEAMLGTLCLHGAVVIVSKLQNGDLTGSKIVRAAIAVSFPSIMALAMLIIYTLLAAHELPRFDIYLDYISVYNFLSPDWALSASPYFFGWAIPLSAVFVVFVDAVVRMASNQNILPVSSATSQYKIFPMALLCAFMSTYYMGRSVDYTIILSLLPFAALAIPASLGWFDRSISSFRPTRFIFLVIPMLAVLGGTAFAFAAMSRRDAPYSLYPVECFRQGNCTVHRLATVLKKRLTERPVLDDTANSFDRGYFDTTGAVRDAVDLLERLQPDEDLAIVLLGSVRNFVIARNVKDDIASDAALMYSGKWHRWPRSLTFADELVPPRVAQIVSAPVQVREGELVLVRREENLLGVVETAILRKVKEQASLCPLVASTGQVMAFRASLSRDCPASPQ